MKSFNNVPPQTTMLHHPATQCLHKHTLEVVQTLSPGTLALCNVQQHNLCECFPLDCCTRILKTYGHNYEGSFCNVED